jgi:hypothetical protein
MLGRASFLQTANRERLIAAAIGATMALAVGLAALAPAPAHASGCEDSWTNVTGGSWFEGGNWSKGAPPSAKEEACITANGTYTVTMTQTSGTVSVKALTVGGSAGKQTLVVGSSCSVNAILATTAGISNGARGAITLTNGDSCGNGVTLSGPITSAGTITAEPAHGGSRTLQGNLTNTGTLAIRASTAYDGAGALLKNEGTINIPEGDQLAVSNGGSVTNDAGGTIFSAGNGDLLQTGGTFTESAGTISGAEAVILDDSVLDYSGEHHGAGRIVLRGTNTLNGDLRSGELLAITSTCSEPAVVNAAGSFFNAGEIEMTNGDSCANNATLNLKGGTLTNDRTLKIANPHGGLREIEGDLINKQAVVVAAGETLHVSGAFTQNPGGRIESSLAESGFGAVSVAGAATIAGKLALHLVAPFKASPGQEFAILSDASLSGTFEKETENQINSTGLYYEPAYSSTGVTLVSTQATLSLSPSGGPSGTIVTVSGSGFLPGDKINPTLFDHNDDSFFFPSVTTNVNGEFSTEIKVPASAVKGVGRVRVTDTLTEVRISHSFTVI